MPPKYFVVDSSVLPDVFVKVVEAKQLMERGECRTVNEAVQRVGIGRSAFYKYRDTVHPFNDMLNGRIVSFQMLLRDEPGALSAILGIFAGCRGNILTINQSLPTGGCAAVTVSAEFSDPENGPEDILRRLRDTEEYVIKCEIVAG